MGDTQQQPPPPFILIRITGANRIVSGGLLTTWYSWVQVEHPNPENDCSRPLDLNPPPRGGEQNDDITSEAWWALEVSGNDNVPTDGSIVAMAWPSRTQPTYIFQYRPKIMAKVGAKKTSGSTTWYEWTEVEPGTRVTAGAAWSAKLNGLAGIEQLGPLLQNPLFEINQAELAADDIVEVFLFPDRVDFGSDDGYLRERPEAFVTETVHGDGSTTHTKQRVKWYGALGGNQQLTITNSTGVAETTADIAYTASTATIQTAIQALGSITAVTVTGTDGSDFTVEFTDDFGHFPPIQVDGSGVFTDTPYFCVAPVKREWFPAIINAVNPNGGNFQYGYDEAELLSRDALYTVKAGGRSGVTAAFISVTHTQRGQNFVLPEIQTITFGGPAPSGATYTVAGQTFNYNDAAATLQAALRTATGDILLAVTGTAGVSFAVSWSTNGPQPLLSYSSSLSPDATLPLYEANQAYVPIGTVVQVWPGYTTLSYRFWASGRDNSADAAVLGSLIVSCGLVIDSNGRVIGGYGPTWFSPGGYADPNMFLTNSSFS